ncbi:MAG: hypothetical protein CMK23_01125 [Porticoccaceae bacterium]|nr:hypothetical protein [Porticoccaceae bacterium]|tara:strand:- start:132 stop:353 length:222 start_codon:yes stop_codon:yes gene_type:complete
MKYKPQNRYEQKQKEQGLVKVTLWIPKQWTAKIKSMGAMLRNDHLSLQRGEQDPEILNGSENPDKYQANVEEY